MSLTASGSAATRSAPRRLASSSRASVTVSRSRARRRAPSVAIRPASWSRLVTMARHPGEPGRSGRTCSALRALSSTTRTRLPASRLRKSPVCAVRSSGIRAGGTPNASRNPCSACRGSSAAPSWSNPRRPTYNCPSGNRSATRCAQCTARAVLPTPAVPDTAQIATAPVAARPVPACCGAMASTPASASRVASSALRPVNVGTAGGNWAGTGTSEVAAAGAGASSARSCRRIAVSRSRNGCPGSMPSSVASVWRNRW